MTAPQTSILRKRLTEGWVGIPNSTVRDPLLTLKATGLLAYLLSLDDGWPVDSLSLTKRKPDGRDAIRSAQQELRQHGYMSRRKYRRKDGTFVIVWEVSDTPRAEWLNQPVTGFPAPVEPAPENPSISTEDLGFEDPEPPLPPKGGRSSSSPRAGGTNPRGPKPTDPIEAAQAAARERNERNAARKRGEACAECQGTTMVETAEGCRQCRACA